MVKSLIEWKRKNEWGTSFWPDLCVKTDTILKMQNLVVRMVQMKTEVHISCSRNTFGGHVKSWFCVKGNGIWTVVVYLCPAEPFKNTARVNHCSFTSAIRSVCPERVHNLTLGHGMDRLDKMRIRGSTWPTKDKYIRKKDTCVVEKPLSCWGAAWFYNNLATAD